MILGIQGQKESGKDTLARAIQALRPEARIFHFADRLKEIVHDVFGVPMDLMNSTDGKASRLAEPVEIDDYLPALSRATGLPLRECGKTATTVRGLLEYVGTNAIRASWDSYWIDSVMIEAVACDLAIIADVRFANEAVAIQQEGGRVIHIFRDGRWVPPAHEAEAINYPADEVLNIRSGDMDAIGTAAKDLVERFCGGGK